jgi:Kef-type K+ transport system membrane component KefB
MTLVGALVLLLLGMIGGRFAFPAGFGKGRLLLLTARWHYLLIGFLLGPYALGLLEPATMAQLVPVLLLGVGWIGLLFGSQFDLRKLGPVSSRYIALLLLQAVFAFLVFAVLGLLIGGRFLGTTQEVHAMVLAAGATACVSGPLAIAVVSSAVPGGRLTEFILLAGSLDGIVGLFALQAVGALYHPRELVARLQLFGPSGWVLIALALGLSFGLLFILLTRRKPTNDQTVLFLLGLVLFLAGAATSLGVFAVFVACIAGIVIANVSRFRRRVYDRLQEWVRPIYVILLVLTGALVYLPGWWIVSLGVAYAITRALAKLGGAWLARHATGSARELPALLGGGLIAQGGMSLVIALSVAIGYRGLDATSPGPANILLSTVAIGVLVSDLAAPAMARHLLGRAGELDPWRWFRRQRPAEQTAGAGERHE